MADADEAGFDMEHASPEVFSKLSGAILQPESLFTIDLKHRLWNGLSKRWPLRGEAVPTSKKQKVKSLAPVVVLPSGTRREQTGPLILLVLRKRSFIGTVRISLRLIGRDIGGFAKHKVRVGTLSRRTGKSMTRANVCCFETNIVATPRTVPRRVITGIVPF